VVERAAILSESDRIEVDAILFSHEITGRNYSDRAPQSPKISTGQNLSANVAEFEKTIVSATLKESASIRKAARSLGLSHTALLNKMKKYHLKMEIK